MSSRICLPLARLALVLLVGAVPALAESAPTVTASTIPTSIIEGESVTLTATVSDLDGTISALLTIDWGDGSSDTLDFESSSSPVTQSVVHTYATAGTYLVSGSIDDPSDGLAPKPLKLDQAIVNVASAAPNGAPVITSLGLSTTLVAIGDPVTVTGAFTDETPASCTATIQWDAAGSAPVAMTVADGSMTAVGSYPAAGVYTIAVAVSDGTLSSSGTVTIVVYDPEQTGSMSGNGMQQATSAAAFDSTSLNATYGGQRAKFSFAADHVAGGTAFTKKSKVEWSYAKGWTFASTSLSVLAVDSLRGIGRCSGTGAINGQGGYTFVLNASDGSSNALRLIVRDAAGSIVYDNERGDPIDAIGDAIEGGNVLVKATHGG